VSKPLVRCGWANSSQDYVDYHDHEWGIPIRDDVALFERLSLEAFQSGLSWITVLRKREAFREVFEGFEPAAVARFSPDHVEKLLQDARIIRHRGKIEATINNATALSEQWRLHGQGWLTETLKAAAPTEHSLAAQGYRRPARELGDLPAKTDETIALAKQLKKAGFVFLGPTTLYAALQATGFVNDHVRGCHRF
jgi:DNA-3-methyladenine glycosylase I